MELAATRAVSKCDLLKTPEFEISGATAVSDRNSLQSLRIQDKKTHDEVSKFKIVVPEIVEKRADENMSKIMNLELAMWSAEFSSKLLWMT